MSKVTLSLIATSLLLAATSAWLARELAAERAKHAGIESVMPAPASLPSASQRLLRAVVREHEQFKALDAPPDEPESWAAIATRRVSLFDHLQLVSQPILSADQMQAVVDFREATGTLPR